MTIWAQEEAHREDRRTGGQFASHGEDIPVELPPSALSPFRDRTRFSVKAWGATELRARPHLSECAHSQGAIDYICSVPFLFCLTQARESIVAICGFAKNNLSNLFLDFAVRSGKHRADCTKLDASLRPMIRPDASLQPAIRLDAPLQFVIKHKTESPFQTTLCLQCRGSGSVKYLAIMETARGSEFPQSDMDSARPSNLHVLLDSLIPAADAIIDQKAQVKRSRDDEDSAQLHSARRRTLHWLLLGQLRTLR